MKTREVKLYIDLHPGWQDENKPFLSATSQPTDRPYAANRRIEILVQLPCFGGTAEAVASVEGEVRV
jgi:hypothetical protein